MSMTESMSTGESSDGDDDDFDPIARQQPVVIMDKKIMTTVTSHAKHALEWVRDVEFYYANPLRLIVGFDIKLASPEPTSTSLYRPIALLLLCVYRSCLIFQIDYATHIPTSISRFVSDRKNNTLVGVGIQSKLVQLQQEFGLGGGARYVDLGNITAEKYNRPQLNKAGLSELRTFLHGADIARPVAGDQWDAEELSYLHVRHACIDAFTCYELGSFLVYPIERATAE